MKQLQKYCLVIMVLLEINSLSAQGGLADAHSSKAHKIKNACECEVYQKLAETEFDLMVKKDKNLQVFKDNVAKTSKYHKFGAIFFKNPKPDFVTIFHKKKRGKKSKKQNRKVFFHYFRKDIAACSF